MLEEVAPGQTLVEIVGGTHDGRQVVVMGAGHLPAARTLAWYLDGDDPPQLPLSPPEPVAGRDRRSTSQRPSAAHVRANDLLESLLSPHQLEDWRRAHRFWVETPYGSVQLGWLYNLACRPTRTGRSLVLCVVPTEPAHRSRMPLPDVWTNLLLTLRGDPERFFRVANWRYADGGDWRQGPAPVGLPTAGSAPTDARVAVPAGPRTEATVPLGPSG